MLNNKHIVFDRDGTCIVYKPYLNNTKDVKLVPGIKEFIGNLLKFNNKLYLHTNQSGVSKGYFTINNVELCNLKLIELLGFGYNIFENICIATENEYKKDSYRKPSSKFGLEILESQKINKSNLFYIGDNLSDLETAFNIGCNAFGIINKDLKENVINNHFNFPVFENIVKLNQHLYGK